MTRGVVAARKSNRRHANTSLVFPIVDDDTKLVRIEQAFGDRRFKGIDIDKNSVLMKLRGSLRRTWLKPGDVVLAVRRTELSTIWFDITTAYSPNDVKNLKRSAYRIPESSDTRDDNDDDTLIEFEDYDDDNNFGVDNVTTTEDDIEVMDI
jgi:translation initiation factor IF-1